MSNLNLSLVVDTCDINDEYWESLRLEVDPIRLIEIASAVNPTASEVNELMLLLWWEISIKWLHKLTINKKFRFSEPRRYVSPVKPFGILLCATLNIQVYLSAFKRYQPDLTVLEAFGAVAIELTNLCLATPNGKRTKAVELRSIVKKLRNNEQPFNRDKFPNLFEWWEAVRPYAGNRKDKLFSYKYLTHPYTDKNPSETGFITALVGWITALHHDKSLVAIKTDPSHLLFHESRGHPIKVLPNLVKNKVVSEILT